MKLDGDKLLADLLDELKKLKGQNTDESLGSAIAITSIARSIKEGEYIIKEQ